MWAVLRRSMETEMFISSFDNTEWSNGRVVASWRIMANKHVCG